MNSEGVTALGQAFITRNHQALDSLLNKGAMLHKECIFDHKVSRKPMCPLHYFIKRIRTQGEDPEGKDEKIKQVLQAHEVKATTEQEISGLLRQLSRFYSTRDQNQPEALIEKYLLPLLDAKDQNILNYTDKNGNTTIHLAVKTK